MVSGGSVLAATGTGLSFPVLPAMVLLPVIGAVIIALTPKSRPELHRLTSVITAVMVAGFSVWVLAEFDQGDAGFQFVVSQTWVRSLDIKFILGIDGISLFLVVLTAILFPLALFAAKPDHDEKGYYLWITLLEAGCMGVFLALDLFLFFLMFELTLVPLYFLIGRWGHGRRVYAATKFFLFTMLGSAFMLVSIVALAVLAGAGDDGGISFDLQRVVGAVQQEGVARDTARWIFLGFVVAFAIKTPVFPFHTWLPDAHTEAPTAGSVDLAGVLLKLGTYGFLRYGLYLFPEASVWFAPVMLTLGTIGIIYGGIVAAMQRNLKRLVAYSSVAHMGFVTMGIFTASQQGIDGAIFQMLSHGIVSAALFLCVGVVYDRMHTREIAAYGGLVERMPKYAVAFMVFTMANVGLPGTSCFVGEFLTLLGAFKVNTWVAMFATTGVVLSACYALWLYRRMIFGVLDKPSLKAITDMGPREIAIMAPLVILTLLFGFYPAPILDVTAQSVKKLVAQHEMAVKTTRSAAVAGQRN
jgi:NADH-quinone oxidoreductase subunit M